ncbi:MAG: dephospho-CoA kinase [Gammaproteobacteria bacterium]|uniref:dephospho-CoA kinase n=1 Tax=Rhodoferax sp. TaxID=50421 RepID=UPI00185F1E6C|nr:dephospho-CoA kinase [Rhodoferax sp.]MBU3900089.1 dephospho-CoA kinase [Gammaproteobacteria bacterium]MBA3059763.1 dephospho-CoA kinase [Rhodoferax sp.]MBU3995927.1 dephospho-CoA kinase [Gammaproteobacteria bacterium]MBU4018273.1 dephospho-CoA kinase [Gammaproteobacteria bacterium]MBU4082127.1 dephospho-CoA kinase [Gammaproteobacteria bacterium]
MQAPLRLGLTGGIGSGKSTVAQRLAELGAAVVDADAISRELTAPGGLAIPLIAATFGPDFITPSGAMDRGKMRALAYADVTARQRLEAIIHPLVRQETQRQTLLATSQGHAGIVFDVPLLVESSTWREQVDAVLVVDCLPATQISRVMARSALTRAEVEKIIAAQADRVRRLKAADAVIFNDRLSLGALAAEVDQVARHFGLSSETLSFNPK